jgi:DNA polymerase-3 subunit gamma/tau
MSDELYKKYRPKTFKAMIGQKKATQTLQNFVTGKKVPHTVLFTGPSGVGKTTLARIMADKLGCSKIDLKELNAASARGIDDMRSVVMNMTLAPVAGKVRVWIIDECQKLTTDAQSSILKMLEDTPKHVYFFLCTTDPHKLLKTIRTRSTEIVLDRMTDADIRQLIADVSKKERKGVHEDTIDKIVELADGSARKALVLLGQVIDVEDPKKQLEGLQIPDFEVQVIELCRIIGNPKSNFKDAAKFLSKFQGDAEEIRRAVLGYMNKILLNKGDARSWKCIDCLRQHTFDSGRPGLHASIYEIYMK